MKSIQHLLNDLSEAELNLFIGPLSFAVLLYEQEFVTTPFTDLH